MTPSPVTSGMAEALSVAALRDQRESSCNPVGAPSVTSDLSENVILTTLDDLHNWAGRARRGSHCPRGWFR
mgnify:CR=1 FL=1